MESINWTEIESVIFDFGGVFLDIDYHATYDALISLLGRDFDFSQYEQADFFSLYECGRLTDHEFRDHLRSLSPESNLSDQQIDAAWNAMLGPLPASRIDFLQQVRMQKRIFLLSNTNAIHKSAIDPTLSNVLDGDGFESLFEKAYWSHLVGMRKPDREIFELVLKENNLNPMKTLFIDDSPQHVKGARLAGLKALHLKSDIENLKVLWEDSV
jgi:putative hydrolase of the HAD superfamily